MRVLHLLPHTDRSGSQIFVRDLAAATERLGHEVTVAALQPGEQRPRLEGIEILNTKAGGMSATWGLRNRMRAVDVTVAHGPAAGEACVRSGTKKTPFVYRQVRDTRFWVRRAPRPAKHTW